MRNVREAVVLVFNIVFRVGLLSNYRWPFWRAVRHALRRGQIDAAFGYFTRREQRSPVHERAFNLFGTSGTLVLRQKLRDFVR